MYSFINDSCDVILTELERISDMPHYLELQRHVRDVNAATDRTFQLAYRDYWRMNVASLGDDYYGRYFARLETLKGDEIVDIDSNLRDLAVIPDRTGRSSLQFSFATKLLHTVDPRAPVYDTAAASFYFFTPPVADKPIAARLDELLGFYAFMRHEYSRVIEEKLLDTSICRLRERFQVGDEVPNERAVDLLIWATVSVLRHGAQRRGQALYR